LLQLNLWGRSPPYAARSATFQHSIGQLKPDLITLQEVEGRDSTDNQAVELLEPLGYEVRFDPRPGRKDFEWGMAIAARHPIGDLEFTDLGHGGVAIAARVRLGVDELRVCSACPLGWWPTQEAQREDECVKLDGWLTALSHNDKVPPVIGGDFDATPDAASIRFLSGYQSLHGGSTHWIDAFASAGDGSGGYTWSADNPFMAPKATATFAEPGHRRRIDYVFVGSPFKWPPRAIVRSASVVLAGDGGLPPSDHFGVMADIEIVPE